MWHTEFNQSRETGVDSTQTSQTVEPRAVFSTALHDPHAPKASTARDTSTSVRIPHTDTGTPIQSPFTALQVPTQGDVRRLSQTFVPPNRQVVLLPPSPPSSPGSSSPEIQVESKSQPVPAMPFQVQSAQSQQEPAGVRSETHVLSERLEVATAVSSTTRPQESSTGLVQNALSPKAAVREVASSSTPTTPSRSTTYSPRSLATILGFEPESENIDDEIDNPFETDPEPMTYVITPLQSKNRTLPVLDNVIISSDEISTPQHALTVAPGIPEMQIFPDATAAVSSMPSSETSTVQSSGRAVVTLDVRTISPSPPVAIGTIGAESVTPSAPVPPVAEAEAKSSIDDVQMSTISQSSWAQQSVTEPIPQHDPYFGSATTTPTNLHFVEEAVNVNGVKPAQSDGVPVTEELIIEDCIEENNVETFRVVQAMSDAPEKQSEHTNEDCFRQDTAPLALTPTAEFIPKDGRSSKPLAATDASDYSYDDETFEDPEPLGASVDNDHVAESFEVHDEPVDVESVAVGKSTAVVEPASAESKADITQQEQEIVASLANLDNTIQAMTRSNRALFDGIPERDSRTDVDAEVKSPACLPIDARCDSDDTPEVLEIHQLPTYESFEPLKVDDKADSKPLDSQEPERTGEEQVSKAIDASISVQAEGVVGDPQTPSERAILPTIKETHGRPALSLLKSRLMEPTDSSSRKQNPPTTPDAKRKTAVVTASPASSHRSTSTGSLVRPNRLDLQTSRDHLRRNRHYGDDRSGEMSALAVANDDGVDDVEYILKTCDEATRSELQRILTQYSTSIDSARSGSAGSPTKSQTGGAVTQDDTSADYQVHSSRQPATSSNVAKRPVRRHLTGQLSSTSASGSSSASVFNPDARPPFVIPQVEPFNKFGRSSNPNTSGSSYQTHQQTQPRDLSARSQSRIASARSTSTSRSRGQTHHHHHTHFTEQDELNTLAAELNQL